MAIEEFKTWKCTKCGWVFHGTEVPKSCSDCDKIINKYKKAKIEPYMGSNTIGGVVLVYGDQTIASSSNDRECDMLRAVAEQLNDCIAWDDELTLREGKM